MKGKRCLVWKERNLMSVKNWVITLLLQCLPIVNIVMLFIWAFGNAKFEARKNYAKAMLIMMAISLVLSIILGMLLSFSLAGVSDSMMYY